MIEHKTISLADQVFEHLENDILSGKYSRGEILTESKLSAELGVSRTPIREALRRLEQLNELKETLELQEFYLNKRDAERIKHMDNQFHRTLYKLSGSMSFYDTLVPLHKKIQKYRKASLESKSRAEASVQEHRRIFEAIESANSELASQYAKEHVENAYNHIVGKD